MRLTSAISTTALPVTLTTALIPLLQNISLHVPPSLTTPPLSASTCYVPGGNIRHPALLSDCYTAIRLVLAERSIVIPQHFSGTRPRTPTPDRAYVPFVRQYKSCLFVLDTSEPRDEVEMLLVRAAYYAAELVQPCVARQKVPLGGRTPIGIGAFFVAVIGAPPEEDGGLGGGNATVRGILDGLGRGDGVE